MLTKIRVQNYFSILDAEITLEPFTLLIGSNGAGKSNFLKTLYDVQNPRKHFNHPQIASAITLQLGIRELTLNFAAHTNSAQRNVVFSKLVELQKVRIFKLVPQRAGRQEQLAANPEVHADGGGTVQVLDSLKTGDREDLFDTIEQKLCAYIPEIEKLSFIPGSNQKSLQVRERTITAPVPVSEISEGSQLIIILLTILYQERPPSLICIEDIDTALHPRLLEKVIQLCFDLAGKEGRPQIIATTHNPYVVDLFKGREDAVVIVEKKDGYTTFTTLEERMEQLPDGEGPLGDLWFSGAVGGVPARKGA